MVFNLIGGADLLSQYQLLFLFTTGLFYLFNRVVRSRNTETIQH